MAKTVLAFKEETGKGWISEFVSVIGREHIQIAKNYNGDGVVYVESSVDGENFGIVVRPQSGRDLLIPIELPDGVVVRVVSTDAVSYAAVIADSVVEEEEPITGYATVLMQFPQSYSGVAIVDGNAAQSTNTIAIRGEQMKSVALSYSAASGETFGAWQVYEANNWMTFSTQPTANITVTKDQTRTVRFTLS